MLFSLGADTEAVDLDFLFDGDRQIFAPIDHTSLQQITLLGRNKDSRVGRFYLKTATVDQIQWIYGNASAKALITAALERFGFFFTDRGIHQNGGNVFCCDLQRLRIAAFLMLFNLCISGLPLFELTTLANTTDASVVPDILRPANAVLFLRERTFLGDKGYDVKTVYNLVKDAYEGEAVIPLNKCGTKSPEKLSVGNPICEAGLAIRKDGKTTDGGGGGRRNTAAPSAIPKPVFAPATTRTGITARRTVAVPSIRPFQQTTDFPLTGNACILSVSMLCVQNVSVTIPVLRHLVKKDFGFEMAAVLLISTQ